MQGQAVRTSPRFQFFLLPSSFFLLPSHRFFLYGIVPRLEIGYYLRGERRAEDCGWSERVS